jgi:di/tricarboxylate transporter
MSFELVLTLVVFASIMLAMLQERVGPDIVMLTGLAVLLGCGVITANDAFSGFANSGLVTIGAMYVVGAGLQSTGGMDSISRVLLGRPTLKTPLVRLLFPVGVLSSVMNNTPIVAFFLPVFVQIAKRLRISPSRLLIPLSYATILGGCCTLVGTSTNLVVNSLMTKNNLPSMTMFELSWVGLPVAVVGVLYLSLFAPRLLPDRQDLLEHIETHRREYVVEMVVREGCPLIGRSVRASGLRDLPGLYLFRIERPDETVSPVDPNDVIRLGDLLCFSGIASTVVDLNKIKNLDPIDHVQPTNGENASLTSLEGAGAAPAALPPQPLRRQGRQMVEVVISSTSPLLGLSIREADFRARYNGSIVAVHRSGEKIEEKIGKITLQSGDTLLVDADDGFVRRWRHSPDFILISSVQDSAPVAHERAWIALTIFFGTLALMSLASFVPALQKLPVFRPESAALLGAVLMVLTGCVRGADAHRSIQMPVVLLVGAALGVSTALEKSGAADILSAELVNAFAGYGPLVVLAVIYLLTMLLTEFLSNNATAAIMGALVLPIAARLQVDARPFLMAVAIASSCAFATPIGYQTNLMVLNPGGYRFMDYVRIGIPLNFLCFLVAMGIIPWVWPF